MFRLRQRLIKGEPDLPEVAALRAAGLRPSPIAGPTRTGPSATRPAATSPAPDQRSAGHRRADERADHEAAQELARAGALAAKQLREVREAAERLGARLAGTPSVACRSFVVHRRPIFSDCGPSVARTATIPIPSQDTSEAGISAKSPIASQSRPNRPPMAAPAQAPSAAAM